LTTSVVEVGMLPRPVKNLLQIFENTSFKRGCDMHLLSQKLIQSDGAKLIEINKNN